MGWIALSAINPLQFLPGLPLSWLPLPWLHDRFRSSSIESGSEFVGSPQRVSTPTGFDGSSLLSSRWPSSDQFEELSDRRMEWSSSHHATSDQWSPQWICARCSRSVGLQDIPSRPTSHCPQCSDSNLTFVLDCLLSTHRPLYWSQLRSHVVCPLGQLDPVHPVPHPQREFWRSTALEIIQMFRAPCAVVDS